MTEPSEGVLRRIQALLDRAAHASTTEHEAQACQERAFAMISAYGVEQAMLAASGQREDEMGTTKIPINDPYALGKAALVAAIAEALHCKAIYVTNSTAKSHVIGYASDRERVEYLYSLLLVQVTAGQNRLKGYNPSQSRSMRVGYLNGFSASVKERLAAAYRRAAEEAPTASDGRSAALVLVDRDAAAKALFDSLFPKTRKFTSRSQSADGYESGRRDGRNADIGAASVQNGRTRALPR